MAEGIVEEDTDEMLGPSGPPMSMQLPNAPTNLSVKDEESDCSETSSIVTSPSPTATATTATNTDLVGCTDLSIGNNNCCSRNAGQQSRQDDIPNGEINNKMATTSQSSSPSKHTGTNTTSQHDYNGAMAGLVTLQNLQNLASLQQSLTANLSTMANLQQQHSSSNTSNVVNAPLNLSVNATSASPSRSQPSSTSCESSPNTNVNQSLISPHHSVSSGQSNSVTAAAAAMLQSQLATPQPNPMPQFILASGQLVQGIQGAQLLIPTSQGVVTQTILTIPVNHINSADQMVNLALNNGQVIQTTLANLQAMAQNNLLANSANGQVPSTNGSLSCQSLFNPTTTTLSHLLSTTNSAQQLLQSFPQLMSTNHSNQHNNTQATPLLSSLAQPLLNQTTPLLSHSSSPLFSQQQTSPLLNQVTNSHNQLSTSSPPPPKPPPPPPPPPPPSSSSSSSSSSSAAAASLRLPGVMGNGHHYGDIKTLSNYQSRNSTSPAGMNNGRSSTTATSDISSAAASLVVQNMKRSPNSPSPDCNNDSSTADLLIDSPNQPTINQANSNVVDGINLDEIKDFAKAFKLRRLSLGLTQTQVGQALSVTEGPAYSQSAICSALASQMVAAAQQQAMFEKLDITPKSAQKIKPVLERWMKEAEERYKSGQNHLTEFIGIEPSKKRKRRTSFTPQALELLNAHFERNTHPSGTEITGLAHQLGYEREVIRIWFCNKRQALKNTVRMMSKGVV